MSTTHGRELANDLARYLELSGNMMSWVEVPLGQSGFERADVIAAAKSFASKRFIIYEVKISRGDFLQDSNFGKYRKYLDHCNQLYFACPSGLIKKAEVPKECGLITKNEKGWHVSKAAPRREFKPSTNLMIRLLLRGYENHFQEYRKLDNETLVKSTNMRGLARTKGSQIAFELSDAEEIIAKAKLLTKRCSLALGENFEDLGFAVWHLEAEVNRLLKQRKFVIEAIELSRICMGLFQGNGLLYDYPSRLRNIANSIEEGNNVDNT